MIKTAKLLIILIMALVLLYTPSFMACADTTGTPEVTPTTISSIKIDRNGNIISESPTTSTTLEKNESKTSSTIKKPDESSNSNNNSSSGNAGQTAAKTTTTLNSDNKKTDTQDADINESNSNGNSDTIVVDGVIGSDDNDESSNGSSVGGNENEKTIVAGEQIENPDLKAEQDAKQKDALRTNPIGFDIKPYLAMAVLVVLAGTTLFSNKQPANRANGAMRDKQYNRSRLS